MTTFTVGTKDFRDALRSVLVHAGTSPLVDYWHRVRVDVGAHNVQVYAAQGFTTGMALVSVEDAGDGELEAFDIAPDAVKDLLRLFPVVEKHVLEQRLELSLHGEEHFQVRDVSGLFPGKTVELPRLASTRFLDHIPPLLGRTVNARARHHLDGVMVTNGTWLGLFATAAKVYGEAVCLTPFSDDDGRGRLLATVGESFIGALIGRTDADQEYVAEAVAHRDAWADRLPVTSGHDPVVDLEALLALRAEERDADDEEGEEAEGGDGS